MLTVPRSRISRKSFVLFMPVALMLGALGAPSVAAVAPKALIDASTVTGSPSQEEAIATAAGFAVTVVSDATWGAMTAADFGQYDLLIAGDPTCNVLPPGLISSAPVYGPVVMGLAGGRTSAGNRIVVGTDPVYHDGGDYTSPGARGTIIREGIAYAGSQPGRTGMFFDSTCAGFYGQSVGILAILEALSAGSGAWTIDAAPPCGGSVSLIAANPSFADLTTASLQGWGCSVHESFPTFQTDWSALAVATDTASHPTCGVDPATTLGACGEAYILIAGSSIVVNSLVISVSPLDSTNPVGTNHTVTANVHAVGGTPVVVGQLVDFSVTGQNAGATGTCVPADCKSDVNGNVAFTYSDANGAGDDTIKASFTDALGSLQTATAQKHWTEGGGGTTLNGLSDAHLWLGLKNSDDQGTQFDVKVELFRNAETIPLAAGLTRCVTGLTRNPALAKDVPVVWDAFTPVSLAPSDVLYIKISTRIGTTPTGTKCSGPGGSHNNAAALRFYYDAASRASRFDTTIGATDSNLYFHSDGGGCDKPSATRESQNVTTRFLDSTAPTGTLVKCKDSGPLNFNGGNPFSAVSIWTLP